MTAKEEVAFRKYLDSAYNDYQDLVKNGEADDEAFKIILTNVIGNIIEMNNEDERKG